MLDSTHKAALLQILGELFKKQGVFLRTTCLGLSEASSECSNLSLILKKRKKRWCYEPKRYNFGFAKKKEFTNEKKVYRVRNWSEYNKGLVNRGSLSVWFDKNTIQSAEGAHGNQSYADALILCALINTKTTVWINVWSYRRIFTLFN